MSVRELNESEMIAMELKWVPMLIFTANRTAFPGSIPIHMAIFSGLPICCAFTRSNGT